MSRDDTAASRLLEGYPPLLRLVLLEQALASVPESTRFAEAADAAREEALAALPENSQTAAQIMLVLRLAAEIVKRVVAKIEAHTPPPDVSTKGLVCLALATMEWPDWDPAAVGYALHLATDPGLIERIDRVRNVRGRASQRGLLDE